ncbi:MAG: hypothetical protein JSR58_07660 [Verrucomicrobia bacterium]|nr:hypothetical protein [Verrucomicrobiota bacterium]
MSAVDVIDDVSGSSMEWTTEMKSYSLNDWNGRSISILLPTGTEYSRGQITTKTENGYSSRPDLVDASPGIPVPASGKVSLSMSVHTSRKNGDTVTTSKVTQMAAVSLSLLPTSKEEFLSQLKKKSVQVISETENALITTTKSNDYFMSNSLVKTIVFDNVVLQIQTPMLRLDKTPAPQLPMYQLFKRIEVQNP